MKLSYSGAFSPSTAAGDTVIAALRDASGRVDTLSLSECHSYDDRPRPMRGYLRFRCPLHGGDHQQSLSVEEATGKFKCHNCGAWGTVTERQKAYSAPSNFSDFRSGGPRPKPAPFASLRTPVRPAPPLVQAESLEGNAAAVERARSAARAFTGSTAQKYARHRGIPDELARAHGLGYWRGKWGGVDSEWLTFPLRCPVTGRVVSVGGRNLQSDVQSEKARVFGAKGIFGATQPGPMPKDVLWVEGAFEVFACLVSPDLPPARAVWGASGRAEWFDGCQRVTLLFDDDEAGHKAADRLAEEVNARRAQRGSGPQVLDIAPGTLQRLFGVKDLGDLLKQGITVKLGLPALNGQFCENASHFDNLVQRRNPAVPAPLTGADVVALHTEFGGWLNRLPETTQSEAQEAQAFAARTRALYAAARDSRIPTAPVALPCGLIIDDPARWVLHTVDRLRCLRSALPYAEYLRRYEADFERFDAVALWYQGTERTGATD